jgi:hypothetical protein
MEILSPFLNPNVKYNQDKLNKLIDELPDLISHSIRPDAYCSCNDERCPHKQVISPLLEIVINKRLKECVDFDIKTFRPTDYIIRDIKDDKSITYKKHVIIFNDRENKEPYSRYSVDENIIKEEYKPTRAFEVFENIFFEDDKMNGKEVILFINGMNIIIKIENNKLFSDGSFILIRGCCYSEIKIIFDKTDLPINCKVIHGLLPYVNLEDNSRKSNWINGKELVSQVGCITPRYFDDFKYKY